MLEEKDLLDLRGVLFSAPSLPTCFYGKYSRLGLSLGMNGQLQISLAKALDPENNTGKAKKGEARYDNDNVLNFTLTSEECYHILYNIKSILDGSYINKNEKNEKYKKIFQFVHFKEDSSTRLFLQQDENVKGALKLTIFPSKNDGLKPISFSLSDNSTLGRYPRSVFMDFVKNVAQNSQYQIELIKTNYKILREVLRRAAEYKNEFNNKDKKNNKNVKQTNNIEDDDNDISSSVSDTSDSDDEDDDSGYTSYEDDDSFLNNLDLD
jgi:hypothetical protein